MSATSANRATARAPPTAPSSRKAAASIPTNRAIRNAILDGFEKSDSGKAFNAAMTAQGFELANGDRRDCFVVIDQAGGHHALNKELTGKTLAEIARAAFRPRPLGSCRSAAAGFAGARQQRRHRAARRRTAGRRHGRRGRCTRTGEHAIRRPRAREPAARDKTARQDGRRNSHGVDAHPASRREAFAEEIDKRGLILVHVTPEQAKASQRAHAFAKAINRQNRALREGFAVVDQRGNVTRIDQRTTGDLRAEIDKRLGGIDRAALMNVNDARQVMADANQDGMESRSRNSAAPSSGSTGRSARRPATSARRGD